jgi:hypothetical protein
MKCLLLIFTGMFGVLTLNAQTEASELAGVELQSVAVESADVVASRRVVLSSPTVVVAVGRDGAAAPDHSSS